MIRDIEGLRVALSLPNVWAFLQVIRKGETTLHDSAYRWLYGSTVAKPKLFDDFSKHPAVRTYETYDGQFIKNGKIDYTTAAGAHQITETTWKSLSSWKFPDFSPESQNLAAVALLQRRGVLQDIMDGKFDLVLANPGLKQEWVSLPGASVGDQPSQKYSVARKVYEEAGGKYTPDSMPATAPAAPTTAPGLTPAPQPQEDKSMPIVPILASLAAPALSEFAKMALDVIVKNVPALLRTYSSGSDMAERNIKGAELVLGTVKEALAVKNEQEVVEQLTSDPRAVELAQAAIKPLLYDIVEVGGGIAAARVAAVEMQTSPNDFSHNPVFWITVGFFLFVAALLGDVFFIHPENYPPEGTLRTQVVTNVLSIIGLVAAFWMGASLKRNTTDK